jgi:hypothetical protein
VAENTGVGAVVGEVVADDQDFDQTLEYTVLGSSTAFSINGRKLVVAGLLDFEVSSAVNITVRATDSGLPPKSVNWIAC